MMTFDLPNVGETHRRIEISDGSLSFAFSSDNQNVLKLPFKTFFLKGEIDSTCAYDDGVLLRDDCRYLNGEIIEQTNERTIVKLVGEFDTGSPVNIEIVAFSNSTLLYVRSLIDNKDHADFFTLNWMQTLLSAKDDCTVAVGESQTLLDRSMLLSQPLFKTDPFSSFSCGSYYGIGMEQDGYFISLTGCGCTGVGIMDDMLYLCPHYDLSFDNARLRGTSQEDLGLWLNVAPSNGNSVQAMLADTKEEQHYLENSIVTPKYINSNRTCFDITSGDMKLSICHHENTMSIAEVVDLHTETIMTHGETPLFEIIIQDTSLSSQCFWEETSIESDLDKTKFIFKNPKKDIAGNNIPDSLADFSCCVTAHVRKKHGVVITFDTQILPSASESLRFTLAPLKLKEAFSDMALVYPKGSGAVLENVFRCKPFLRYLYPTQLFAMPFFALYGKTGNGNRGLYCGVHDKDAVHKELYADYAESDSTITLYNTLYECSAEVEWQFFDGDWYDAAVIYKSWIENHAPWIHNRIHNIPDWFDDVALWLNESALTENWAENVLSLQRSLNVNVGVHLYHWHEIPFDNDYPHYIPARNKVAEDIAFLQSNNIRVMPYINGRLWDTRDREDADWQFTEKAFPAVCKYIDGSPVLESYASREKDGSRVVLGVMCPSQQVWVDKITEVVVSICCELGADGVYIDQIAAAPQAACRDSSHGHPLGHGGWWVDSYYKLLENVYSKLPPDKILTTESCAEVYCNMLDGFLTWHCQIPQQKPILHMIYANHLRLFGRAYVDETDPLTTKATLAQQIVFAEEPGWFSSKVLHYPHYKFIERLLQLRVKIATKIQTYKMLKPLDVALKSPNNSMYLGWFPEQSVFNSIQTGVFSSNDCTELLVIAVNTELSAYTISLNDIKKQYNLTDNISVTVLSHSEEKAIVCDSITIEGESAIAMLLKLIVVQLENQHIFPA